ncbi:MAG: glycosyltransferase, partial [Gemmataceae bacterium]|nr:glycosyltransferase [Gemmataceae bacterium]
RSSDLAMGKPIVCSPVALNGLRHPAQCGAAVTRDPAAFARNLIDLWGSPETRAQAGETARRWVLENHTWESAARTAAEGLAKSLGEKK